MSCDTPQDLSGPKTQAFIDALKQEQDGIQQLPVLQALSKKVQEDQTPRRELSEEEKKIIAARQGGRRFTPEEERKYREKGRLLKVGMRIPIRGDGLVTVYEVKKAYGAKSNKPAGAVLLAPINTIVLSQVQKPGPMIQVAGGAR